MAFVSESVGEVDVVRDMFDVEVCLRLRSGAEVVYMRHNSRLVAVRR